MDPPCRLGRPLMPKTPHLFLMSAAAAVSFAPAPAAAETLAEVVAYAYEINPGIQAQRAALRALDESYVQARSGYGLNASVNAGLTSFEIRRSGGKADAETDSLGLTVTQPLYTGGRVANRLMSSEAQILAAREQLRRAEHDLLQRVVAAYMGVLRDEQLLVLARDSVQVLERYYNDTQSRAEVRTVTMTDVQQSRARLSQARTQLAAIEEQLAVSRAQFVGVVGRNPRSLDPPPSLETLPNTFDEALNAGEANSPQLLYAVYTEQASRARVALAKSAAAPQVTARFDMQRQPLQPYQPGPYDDTRSASVVFTQPLLAGGQIRSAIRQAVEENNRDRLLIDEVRLQVIQNVTQSWERLASLRRQIETLQEEVSANELAFFGVRQEERFALRSNIEVLNASAELSQAQQNLTRARAAEYVARIGLLSATGTLTPEGLAPSAEAYDPSRNFNRVKNLGATPLEIPARILDAIASPPVGPRKPASIRPDHPVASPPEPIPKSATPLRSSLELMELDVSEAPAPQAR